MAKPVDVHCHVFNKDILTFRIILHLVESLIYAFYYRKHLVKDSDSYLEFINELRKIYHFVKVGLQESSIDVYKSMQEEYVKAYGQGFIAVPLTFDLYFAFKGSMRMKKKETVSIDDMAQFIDNVGLQVKSIITNLSWEQDAISSNSVNYAQNDSHGKIEEIKDEMNTMLDFFKNKLENIDELIKGIKLVGSFKRQLADVQKLSKKFPGEVYPFYAADARRFNIVNQIKKNVSKEGPFFGVKIYTPNGYSPTDPDMQKIFKHCCIHNIPVTAHCSRTGFATFENTIRINGLINDPVEGIKELKKEKYSFSIPFLGKGWVEERASLLNDPDIWGEVLKKFPDLKLNLAHFGRWEEGYEWSEKIYKLMKKYKNLYTDFSCVSETKDLEKFREYWLNSSKNMKKRFMYGSDYYLNLLFASSFQSYLMNFKDTFSDDEFQQLAVSNPRKFLGIDL